MTSTRPSIRCVKLDAVLVHVCTSHSVYCVVHVCMHVHYVNHVRVHIYLRCVGCVLARYPVCVPMCVHHDACNVWHVCMHVCSVVVTLHLLPQQWRTRLN